MAGRQVRSVEADTVEPEVSTGVDKSANLDFLRSCAVLFVLGSHVILATTGIDYAGVARTGVILFFIHTCYVLLRSLDRLHADGHGPVAVRFFVQRIFRIYPLYLAVITATLLFRVPWNDTLGPHPNMDWLGWPWFVGHILLLQNLGGLAFLPGISRPMWSLPYEMQMYWVLPAVYLLTLTKDAITKLLLIACFAGLAALFTGFSVTLFVPCFFGGAYAFVVSRRRLTSTPFAFLPAILAISAIIMQFSPAIVQVFAQWFICTAIGFALPQFRELSVNWLRSAYRHVATYSYGVYLWHWPLLWLCFRKATAISLEMQGVLFICSIAVLSAASYHLLEAPMIRLGRRLSRSELLPAIDDHPSIVNAQEQLGSGDIGCTPLGH